MYASERVVMPVLFQVTCEVDDVSSLARWCMEGAGWLKSLLLITVLA